MRTVIPWAPGRREYHQLVARVLESDGLAPEAIELEDEFAYSRLLIELWEQGETFVLVEHDIIPWPWAVDAMVHCPHGWCRYPYRQHSNFAAGFGCTKFESALIAKHPHLVREAAAADANPWKPGDWRIIDVVIDMALRRRSVEPHEHMPGVAHLSASVRSYRRPTT